MNIESQNIIVKNTLPSKCFDFWFEKHPILCLWIWLLIIFILSIVFSES